MCSTEIAVWPDYEWCYRDDLEEHLIPPCAKSDDYMLIDVGVCSEEQIDDFVRRYLCS